MAITPKIENNYSYEESKRSIIDLIANRIKDEYMKHPQLDWAKLAAIKIYETHLNK